MLFLGYSCWAKSKYWLLDLSRIWLQTVPMLYAICSSAVRQNSSTIPLLISLLLQPSYLKPMFYQFNLRAGKLLSFFLCPSFLSCCWLHAKAQKPRQQTQTPSPMPCYGKSSIRTWRHPLISLGPSTWFRKKIFSTWRIGRSFWKSERVVFEIDMDDMSDMGSLMGMMSGLMMKDGMTLQKLLTPAEYQEVSDYFEAMGMPMFCWVMWSPFFSPCSPK